MYFLELFEFSGIRNPGSPWKLAGMAMELRLAEGVMTALLLATSVSASIPCTVQILEFPSPWLCICIDLYRVMFSGVDLYP